MRTFKQLWRNNTKTLMTWNVQYFFKSWLKCTINFISKTKAHPWST